MPWNAHDEPVPFHLPVYYRNHTFIRIDDLDSPRPPRHVEIYVTSQTPLRYLPHLLSSSRHDIFPYPALGTRLVLQIISPASAASGRKWVVRNVGSVVIGGSGVGGLEEDNEGGGKWVVRDKAVILEGRTVGNINLQPGDILSIAVISVAEDGNVQDEEAVRRDRGERERDRDRDGDCGGRGRITRDRGWGVMGSDRFKGRSDIPRGDWKRGEEVGRKRESGERW